MAYVALLGDSIFDNAAYTRGGPAVIAQVQERLPRGWRATLAAVDGAVTRDVPRQCSALAADVTHLVLSVGGNDALGHAGILGLRVTSANQAFLALEAAIRGFAQEYERTLAVLLKRALPLTVCTIYRGHFPEADYQRAASVALAAFNDAVLESAVMHGLDVIDLRSICSQPEDYANPIEPSSVGGAKIAAAIVRAIALPHERDVTRLLGPSK